MLGVQWEGGVEVPAVRAVHSVAVVLLVQIVGFEVWLLMDGWGVGEGCL